MRQRTVATCLLVGLVLGGPARTGSAEEDRVRDAWIEAALEAAGPNRAALEAALAHFEADPDPRKREAMRFLVANLPGRGYVVTALRTEDGTEVPYDPTAYPDFAAARDALERLEEAHGELSFDRREKVEDVRVVTAAYLIRHVERAFEAWERVPARHRVGFPAFLEHVLPHRGSQEPIDDWLDPLLRRYAAIWKNGDDADPQAVYARVAKEAHQRVRFDERYYLHPTDQGYTEMSRSGLGRCEDITNMITYAARSVGLATAADFTPAWGHRDNNHAWNVLLDADGRGADPAQAHAAKIYRKTFAIQRDALPFRLPEGREAPNRFLASPTIRDVTDQYGPTTDVEVALDPEAIGEEPFAYLCVFNGGRWVAVQWAALREGRATFARMGRDLLYLPAVHDGAALIPAAPPILVEADGEVVALGGDGAPTSVWLAATRPRQKSPDTHVETPVSFLEPGTRYQLKAWAGDWVDVASFEAGEGTSRSDGLAANGLYWLVAEGSRRLERPFLIRDGRQRFR